MRVLRASMSKDSNRVLRNIPRVNYEEPSTDTDERGDSSADELLTSFNSCLENSAIESDLDISANTVINENLDISENIIPEMAHPKLPQLIAELNTIFFQLEEIAEIVKEELSTLSFKAITELN